MNYLEQIVLTEDVMHNINDMESHRKLIADNTLANISYATTATPNDSIVTSSIRKTSIDEEEEQKEVFPITILPDRIIDGETNNTCSVCGDEIQSSKCLFLCNSGKSLHSQCISCFESYVDSCCNNYSTGKSFPLVCPYDLCNTKISEHVIKRLINHNKATTEFPNLLEKYEKVSVKSGILDLTQSESNIEYTCTKCNKFTVLLPKDYKSKAAKLKKYMKAPSSVKTDESMLTSLFLDCENDNCGYTTCLLCSCTMKNWHSKFHKCSLDSIDSMYNEITDLLAEGSIVRCPKCSTPGIKDLACTHMSCSKCNIHFCYCCGKASLSVGGFQHHNSNWHIGSTDPRNGCPMYLQYMYGNGVLNHPQYNDNTETTKEDALKRFHIKKQIQLVEQKKQTFNIQQQKIFDTMLEMKFPDGLYDPIQYELLKKNELEAKKYALAHPHDNLPAAVPDPFNPAGENQVNNLNIERELAALNRLQQEGAIAVNPVMNNNRRNNQCCIIC